MSNPITWQDVTALATEHGETPLDAQTAILEHVNTALNVNKLKPKALRLARISLAAHLATMIAPASSGDTSGSGTVAGPIVSERVGDISRTYAAVSTAVADVESGIGLNGTEYGQTFAMLIRTSAARLPFALTGR